MMLCHRYYIIFIYSYSLLIQILCMDIHFMYVLQFGCYNSLINTKMRNKINY